MKTEKEKMLILLILGILLTPIVTNIFVPSTRFSDLENRVLSQKIKWDGDMLRPGILAERVESYVQDQFPLRDFLINLKSDMEVVIGKEANNGVYKGKEGYLFKKPVIYEEETFLKNMNAINILSEYLQDELSIIIVPPSSMVLEEKLPSFVNSDREKKYYRFILNELKSSQVLPVLEKLEEHDQEKIYFKTDHHWTQYGAYLAYEELMHSTSGHPVDNTSFSVHKIRDFQGTLYSRFRGSFVEGEDFVIYEPGCHDYKVEYIAEDRLEKDLLHMDNLDTRDKYKVYLDGDYPLIRIRNTYADQKEKVLVIKDSYANAMAPYLAQSFSEVHYIDLRYNNSSLKEYILKEDFTRVVLIYGMDTIGEDPNLKKLAY